MGGVVSVTVCFEPIVDAKKNHIYQKKGGGIHCQKYGTPFCSSVPDPISEICNFQCPEHGPTEWLLTN